LGWLLTLIFSARFLIEFYKENQSAFESGLALNMGQILSIPLIITGVILLILKSGPQREQDKFVAQKL
jgi:prolipoprotein diacylglyceryltransferase